MFMASFKYNFEMNNRIKEIRIEKGISQKMLANAVNIKVPNLSKYENLKECIPIINFNNICNYLEISFDYALCLSNKNNLYQETLAMEIGTSKSLICEYEKGKKLLSLPYAYAICKKYDVSVDYIYCKVD